MTSILKEAKTNLEKHLQDLVEEDKTNLESATILN